MQVTQASVLHWPRAHALGLLGLSHPEWVASEGLHFAYNFVQWLGLLLLARLFTGRARPWWRLATVVQSFHFFEHVLSLGQQMSGVYLFGATHQTSIGELVLPRIELHFVYVTLVCVPTLIAVILRQRQAHHSLLIK